MTKWLVAFAILGALWFWLFRSVMGPSIDLGTYVETPETWDAMHDKYDPVVNSRMRVTPPVDVSAPETVIRWPAWKSPTVAAPPLELRIRRDQWARDHPVNDSGWIGPSSVALRLDWPEGEEERRNAPAGERPPVLYYLRNTGGQGTRDLLYDEEYRSNREIAFATPLSAPRDEAVVVYCSTYGRLPCSVRFEYLGRPAELSVPHRRGDDWREAYDRARGLLATIAKPIAR